jgi:bifunctional aspartokinase / homoserine dehydrogenase 1
MQVIKFGGSSVANAENINKVIAIAKNKQHKTIVVVSALGGITDALLSLASQAAAGNEAYKNTFQEIENRHIETVANLVDEDNVLDVLDIVKKLCGEIEDISNGLYLLGELTARSKDKIVSYGELLSSQIIAAAIQESGQAITWVDSRSLIVTDNNYGNAAVDFVKTDKNIVAYFEINNNDLFIAPGFVSSNAIGITTTLGRGGSDYTAAIFAGALQANDLEIWTDVSGMMTADPRMVSKIKAIPEISYQEAMELSHFGAKVIYPPTIQPVMDKNIRVWIKNTFAPNDIGTVIKNEVVSNDNIIRGISSIKKIVLISLEGSGMAGIPGFSKKLFEALANHKINVILITQSSSEHAICVGIDADNASIAKQAVDMAFAYEIETQKVNPLLIEKELSIVAVVGDNMKNHTGIAGKMFSALGKNGVNIRAIAQGSSERNISAIIAEADVAKAVNVLHETFFETTYKQVHVFIAGVGNVGSKLLQQLNNQIAYLQNKKMLQIKVVGIANSKQVLLQNDGIDLNNWETALQAAPLASIESYAKIIVEKNLRNSIFVDVTANDNVPNNYLGLIKKNIAVVACNKVACSANYTVYNSLKTAALNFNTAFLYETNVGASLPIIKTINDLVVSGDTIHNMQAVLSGSLNFIFNNYDGTQTFASVVKQAQLEGYTEPDPRLDLSGKDVMRKILILARETGEKLEIEDIANESFMPESCMAGSVENFYAEMEKHDDHFKKLYADAKNNNCKLKFVASYNAEGKKASVGLQQINTEHDFYHLYGKDNIVLFYTDRYTEQPLVIKGAGAGAAVTASGIFADILRAVNK